MTAKPDNVILFPGVVRVVELNDEDPIVAMLDLAKNTLSDDLIVIGKNERGNYELYTLHENAEDTIAILTETIEALSEELDQTA